MRICLIILLIGVFILNVDGLTRFIRGRRFLEQPQSPLLKTKPASYFEQRLDHFDQSETTTWSQRFWMNDDFFDGSGPVFLMIGGEGEENPIWMENGQWIERAKQFKALCFMLEHRFYGKSQPTNDLSTANLAYLSSEQSLADLANFRQYIQRNFNLSEDTNKWISFGGSYPGSLSAWFRLKYPHLVHAAVASSAPMLALVDFTAYMEVVDNSLNAYSPLCTQQVSAATQQMVKLMQSDDGRHALEKMFRTCEPIASDDDVVNFYSTVANNFEDTVQYNKDNKAFEGGTGANITIDVLCDIMMSQNVSESLRLYASVNDLIMSTHGDKCLDASYASFIKQMQAVAWNTSAAVGGRQWTYQTCIEFGFFQSTDSSRRQPFGDTMPVEFFIKQCVDIFGEAFNLKLLQEAVYNTNVNYGGYKYEASRVVFVNGGVDPWHALGFTTQPPNPYTEVVFINATAHCADMYPSGDNDPIELTQARVRIGELIAKWLSV